MIDRRDQLIADLRSENAALRLALAGDPASPLVDFVRFVAPFIHRAIEDGVWCKTLGVEAVERETRSTLALLDRWAPSDAVGRATETEGGEQ